MTAAADHSKLAWVISTPFGVPVVPDVKAIAASSASGGSSGAGRSATSRPPGAIVQRARAPEISQIVSISCAVKRGSSGTSAAPLRQMPKIVPRLAKEFSTRSAMRAPGATCSPASRRAIRLAS